MGIITGNAPSNFLGYFASDPSILLEGHTYYNTVSKLMVLCDGAGWVNQTPSSGGGGTETTTTMGALIHGASSKTTPVDADEIGLVDSAASNILKKLTWANLKATLKTYLDTLYQPVDSDLTTIAGLTATTDNFMQSKSSAWASRTVAQVKTDLGLTGTNSGDETTTTIGATTHGATAKTTPVDADEIGLIDSAASNIWKKVTWANVKATLKTYLDTLYQPVDTDLTTLAGLTATTDSFLQSKSSAWAARTIAQVKTDLGLTGTNSGDQTISDATITLTDVTTNNSSTSNHGFLKKLDNNSAHFMNGQGGWSTPAGTGGVAADAIFDAKGDLAVGTGADASARLAVGTDGQFIVADSTQTTGLKYTDGIDVAGLTQKSVPIDADEIIVLDSAASLAPKYSTWTNIKAFLKTYLDTLYQPLDSDLTTIAGLTATTNNFLVSVSSAWASRTPAQVKTTLSLDNVDNTSDSTKNSATATLTNKRVTQRVSTTASSTTPTPNADTDDVYTVTALAAGATFGAPTGTPTEGQTLMLRIKDNGTARTLAFNAVYRIMGTTLPTTTVISKTIYIGLMWNGADSKWDVLGVNSEA